MKNNNNNKRLHKCKSNRGYSKPEKKLKTKNHLRIMMK